MKRPSRYSQLNEAQRHLIRNDEFNVIIRKELNPYLGDPKNRTAFIKATEKVTASITGWKTESLFTQAFVIWCNNETRQSPRTIGTGATNFENGFVQFVKSKNLSGLQAHEIDSKLVAAFVRWLATEKGQRNTVRAMETQRKHYGIFKTLLEILKRHKETAALMCPDLSFPNNPYSGSRKTSKQTEVIDDLVWLELIAACRIEIAEIVQNVKNGWQILSLPEVHPDDTRRGRGKYKEFAAALWEAKRLFPTILPSLRIIRKANKDFADSIQYNHQTSKITRPFYPTAEDIIPFIILHSIYTCANTGPLRALKWDKTKIKEILKVKRVEYTFVKPRAHLQYSRSFALQPTDMYSPYELHLFLKKWTRSIRARAGQFIDNIYIFQTFQGRVRGFRSSQDVGDDSDSTWKSVLTTFLKRHGLQKITVSMLRMTGLDIVREQSGDDIRAVMAAGGHSAQTTIDTHYDGAGTKRRRHENLSVIMLTQERWVATDGKIDIRATPKDSSVDAATPGWHCLDPFDSPIPGEKKGKLCQALGQCPACPLGSLNTHSGYSLARVLQLADEVRAARFYLDAARWNSAYEPVHIALVERWLPLFDDQAVWEAAAVTNLTPIGTLE